MFSLLALCLASTATAHTFISVWGPKGGNLEPAQKSDLKTSSYRSVSGNTGWVGSKFLTTDAIACSAQNTPFGQVAAPTGLFSLANQSPGKSLSIAAGSTIQFVTSGNGDDGYPHRNGHIQVYLADCGGSCANFDVTTAQFFKIHQELNGVQNTLIPALDKSVHGNRYDVTIPASVPAGNYIWRLEIISFGQSSDKEGGQDQYYPSCASLTVTGSGQTKRDLEIREAFERATAGQLVKFPGAYQNGNIDQKTAPGPAVITGAVPSASNAPSASGSTSSDSGSDSSSSTSSSTTATGGAGAITLSSSAPACASMCLSTKISEKAGLGAGSCDDADGACLCAVATFMTAFQNCANDNCGSDAAAANSALQSSCSGLSSATTAGSNKSKRSNSADHHLASGKSKRIHRIKKRGSHPIAQVIRQTTQH